MKVAYTINQDDKTITFTPSENGWELVWKDFTNIKPLFNYCVIEKDEEKEVSKGGILIPDSSKEKPSTGIVVSVGDGLINEMTGTIVPMSIKVGDRVLFGKFAGQTIKLDGEVKTLLKETEILAIIK